MSCVLLKVMLLCSCAANPPNQSSASAAMPLAPIPESEQPSLAIKIIDTYHGQRPDKVPLKKLYVVYFTCPTATQFRTTSNVCKLSSKTFAAFIGMGCNAMDLAQRHLISSAKRITTS